MLIELPMVALKGAPAAAKAFISYAHAPKQQAIFAANGYRPVVKSVLKRPNLASWRSKYDTGSTFNIRDRLFGVLGSDHDTATKPPITRPPTSSLK